MTKSSCTNSEINIFDFLQNLKTSNPVNNLKISFQINNNIKNYVIHNHWFGLTNYKVGLELQDHYVQQISKKSNNEQIDSIYLLGFEHEPVITLGFRADPKNEVIYPSEKFLIQKVDRGGFATIHNPGQLVVYPLLRLADVNLNISEYVDLLIRVSQRFLSFYGVLNECKKDSPGLYTYQGKIMSIGLRNDKGYVRHGISINVFNDLTDFACINTCGVKNLSMDKMQNHVEFQKTFSNHFSNLNLIEKQQKILSELFIKWGQLFEIELKTKKG